MIKEYVEDAKGNINYISYFGSEEAAQEALDSLEDCLNCINCSDCSDCSDCSVCEDLTNVKSGLKPSNFVPVISDIDKKVYEACSQPQALDMGSWHTCETTHCRAGWVVTLAGKDGKQLEMYHGTALAAQLIYRESGSPINPCRFYDNNVQAMADMKSRAEKSAQFCEYKLGE